MRISFYQFLYTGKRIRNTKKLSDVSIRHAKSEYEKIKQETIYKAKINFYKYKYKLLKLSFMTEKLEYLKQVFDMFNLKTNDDILIFKAYLRELEKDIEENKLEKEIVRIEFLNCIGIDFDTIIELVGELKPEEQLEYDLPTCIARAFQLRPEMLKSQAQEELGVLEMNICLAERTPVIALGT